MEFFLFVGIVVIIFGLVFSSRQSDRDAARSKALRDAVWRDGAEARQMRESEKKAGLDSEEKSHLEEKSRLEAAEAERVMLEKSKALVQINLLHHMKKSLPFYCSVTVTDGTLHKADGFRWRELLQAVQNMDDSPTELYFVKLLSLLDNREHWKIGVTRKSIEERFGKSTQVEHIETIASFKTQRYIALFAEYHFIREFEITEKLSLSLEIDAPDVHFSGSSEVVRPNAIGKISRFFEKLSEYEDAVKQGPSSQLKESELLLNQSANEEVQPGE